MKFCRLNLFGSKIDIVRKRIKYDKKMLLLYKKQ